MLQPTLPGWRAETVGDDIAWMRFGEDGRLYAVNPEFGFFGVAPGTNWKTNPNAMRTMAAGNSIFTNTALTDDGDVWWEGMEGEPRAPDVVEGRGLDARLGRARRPPELALHHADQPVPHRRARVGRPERRADLGDPVRRQAQDHRAAGDAGPRLAARHVHGRHHVEREDRRGRAAGSARCAATRWRCCRSSATTSATTSSTGWRSASPPTPRKLPKIFYVNWFRRGDDGRFLWPGFGENSRVLKWAIERIEGKAAAVETPVGHVPTAGRSSTSTASTPTADDVAAALAVDADEWREEIPLIEEWFDQDRGQAADLDARRARGAETASRYVIDPRRSTCRSDSIDPACRPVLPLREVTDPCHRPTPEEREGLRFSPWNFLLLLPFLMLVTPWFNMTEPRLFGMPYFYWVQFVWVVVGVVSSASSTSRRVTRRTRRPPARTSTWTSSTRGRGDETGSSSSSSSCCSSLVTSWASWPRAGSAGNTLDHLDEWGLGGRKFGSWITWFLVGGDLYTAYTFVAVPALLFGAGALGSSRCPTP